MGACLSKKKGSSTSSNSASKAPQSVPELNSGGCVTVSNPKVDETEPQVNKKTVHNEEEGQVKNEIFIIKHRKGHDDNREGISKNAPAPQSAAATIEEAESMGDKTAAAAANVGVVGVRTSSCTKEEVDAILIQCGRLCRNSSGKASSAAAGEHGRRRYSGSKRSFDFDHCDNDIISTDEDQKKANANDNSDICEDDGVVAAEKSHQHRHRYRQSPGPHSKGRRRTPSREREQQRSSSRERRVSRSPGKRSSEATTPANASNNSNANSRPGKMVSVPATVSSLVMDKSNSGGGGESATATGIKRITVKRNVGAASPRSQSPARANGNAASANKVFSENQKQPSLSRNSSRKAEQSPHRRNPLSEVDLNTLAYPQSTVNNNSSSVQNRSRKEIETEANKKPNVDMKDISKNRASSRVAVDKGVSANCKTKVQQEDDVKVQSSMTDNIVVMTLVPPGVDNLKPQTLTRSRSSRQSRDFDLNPPEVLLVPPQSYTSLLLEDIQNFHQKNTPSVSLPACLTKACSILEAVADLNSTTSSNFPGAFTEDSRNPPGFQSSRNEYKVPLGTNHYGKRVPDSKDPFVESEVVVNDDVMEPSLHKYVTVKRGGSLGGIDMEDQESSGSNSFIVSSGQQQHRGISSTSWEPSSAESKDCWTSRLDYSREESQKSPLGLEGRVSSEAGLDVNEGMKKLNSKRRECDHQNGNGIGRGRLGATNKGLHMIPVVTAAAST